MLKKLSEKLRAKFPATTPSCSMETFFNPKQARMRANHSSKKNQGKKERGKKNSKF